MKELEDVITEVGGHGKFQKMVLYMILAPVYFFQPLYWMNELFFLHVPDHWCNHPQSSMLTLNETQFKECYIPRKEIDNSFDNCKILLPKSSINLNTDIPESKIQNVQPLEYSCPVMQKKNNPVKSTDFIESSCEWGWNFDKSEFSRTIVTDLNWFCDDAKNIPTMYTYSRIGSMIGGIGFNYLGDRFGRKPIFWITATLVTICMTVKTFLAQHYYAYVALKLVASSTFISIFQLPFSIICEVSDASYRTWAILVSWLVWILGFCALPLIGWLANGNWVIISLITGPPTIIVFIGWKLLPESPRWLLSRPGRIHEAAEIFKHMAKVNNKKEPSDLLPRLQIINQKIMNEKSYGYISLFTRWGMAKKSILLATALTASQYTYFVLTVNLGNMGGSTYLNLFILSAVEIPATYLSTLAADRYGRRWSHVFLLLLGTLCMAIVCTIANYEQGDIVSMWAVNILCFLGKFICTAAFYMFYVQAAELNPTPIRNSGMGFASFSANIVGLSGPTAVHLATIDKRIPYGIIAIISFVSAIAASFLPETLGCYLPETISSAAEFGNDQKYFSWIRLGHVPDNLSSTRPSFRLKGKKSKLKEIEL